MQFHDDRIISCGGKIDFYDISTRAYDFYSVYTHLNMKMDLYITCHIAD